MHYSAHATRQRRTTAMARGARAKINGKFVVEPQFQRAVTAAQWEQLYPQWLLDETDQG